MPSVVDVCNRALDKLGQIPITSLTDGNTAANLCDRVWPITRDQVLREHPWNFAIRRTTTAPETSAPSWGFLYKHALPSNCLRLIEVDGLTTGEYLVEGRYILTDENVLYLRYLARIEDPNEFDSLFTDVVATRMAFDMCEGLTQSTTKKDWLYKEYEDLLLQAKRADGQENPPAELEEDDWINVRY